MEMSHLSCHIWTGKSFKWMIRIDFYSVICMILLRIFLLERVKIFSSQYDTVHLPVCSTLWSRLDTDLITWIGLACILHFYAKCFETIWHALVVQEDHVIRTVACGCPCWTTGPAALLQASASQPPGASHLSTPTLETPEASRPLVSLRHSVCSVLLAEACFLGRFIFNVTGCVRIDSNKF